ncbi:hypothetical protein CH305_18460 [Rhodococcus sp. 15-649-2-2]|uniref:hypothetical protein n=1 Tax=Rhodococcus sp. 15-649-2-2 TaxID=2023140 RepID=UPI000B9B7796|nr:hypothetical protein [Rhodococcus sp. 15-649-2-2]OZE77220.1 hypothetical protein CH305_18460 [Rhodococcus sp. 15-649-2-2]
MGYVVTAPLVGVNGEDGKLKMLYKGALVPADVSAEDLERLEDGGLITKTDDKSDDGEPSAAEKRAAAAAAKAAAGAKA